MVNTSSAQNMVNYYLLRMLASLRSDEAFVDEYACLPSASSPVFPSLVWFHYLRCFAPLLAHATLHPRSSAREGAHDQPKRGGHHGESQRQRDEEEEAGPALRLRLPEDMANNGGEATLAKQARDWHRDSTAATAVFPLHVHLWASIWLLLRSIVGGMYAECLFSGVGGCFAICPSIAELASLVASPAAVSLEMKG